MSYAVSERCEATNFDRRLCVCERCRPDLQGLAQCGHNRRSDGEFRYTEGTSKDGPGGAANAVTPGPRRTGKGFD